MYFSFIQCVATGSGVHQATYLMCTGGRRPGNETDRRTPAGHEVQNVSIVPTLLLISSWQARARTHTHTHARTHTLHLDRVCIVSRVNWSDISSVAEKLLYFCHQSNGCYWLPDYRVTRENVYYSRIRTCMCLPQSWASKHSTQVAPPAFPGRFGVCTIDHFWPHVGEPVKWKINCIVERDVSNEL